MTRIIQLSDTHLFADPAQQFYGISPRRHLERVLRDVVSTQRPELVLVTGDLVHDESEAGYYQLLELCEQLSCPVRCLPGNHDDPPLMRRILTSDRVSCEPVIRVAAAAGGADWVVLLLDSFQPGRVSGRIAGEQLRWLEESLALYRDCHVLVALHHPLLTCGTAWLDDGLLLEDPAAVLAVLERSPAVRAVLWGHIHQEFERRLGQVLFLGAPSTAAQFRHGSSAFALDEALEPGYRWLELGPGGELQTGICRVAG